MASGPTACARLCLEYVLYEFMSTPCCELFLRNLPVITSSQRINFQTVIFLVTKHVELSRIIDFKDDADII